MNPELVLDAQATLGEGAIWHAREQRLYWVDIDLGRLHRYDPVSETDQVFELGQMIGTVVPRAGGGLMVALQHGFAAFDPESGELAFWGDPEQHLPRNRFNDGKCDPAGRFWAGTISLDRQQGAASLYCLEPDGRVRTMWPGVTNSNGIAWSLDRRTMYYIDTPTQQVTAFDYELASGQITNPRVVISIPAAAGKPDGMTIDEAGMLWIALWEGSCVGRWDPHSGTQLLSISLPVRRVTSCAFGGAQLDELYITTARTGLTESDLASQPQAGGLFRVRPGVRGVAAFEFQG
ncbi:MAG: SMP-30/gluconolactonase/LRE family protein [Planctomycetaceae bacterium]|nr:SMP-30/gluconolactonase/LRE family protein [Planctomycetaceae bacterium]